MRNSDYKIWFRVRFSGGAHLKLDQILDNCSHMCELNCMRTIKFYRFDTGKCPVEDFFDRLNDNQFEKISFVLDLIEQIDIVPRKFFKKLKGTDEIWEVRVQYGSDIFRILGFFDGPELVILNHAFAKKSQKTPRNAITVAEKRKRDYFRQKELLK